MQKDHGESPVVTDDVEPPSSLAQLTAEIVSAYVSNNKIAPADLAALITTVGSQIARLAREPDQPAEEKPEPAVSVRRSIQRGPPRSAWSAASRRRCSSATSRSSTS